jgi:hypothetical protein
MGRGLFFPSPTEEQNTMSKMPEATQLHSSAWVAQTWIAFVAAVGVTTMGIWFLPVDVWVKAFMGMGLLFTVGTSVCRRPCATFTSRSRCANASMRRASIASSRSMTR